MTPTLRKGKSLPFVKPGAILGRKSANELIAFYNMFMNGDVQIGEKTELTIGDRRFSIDISRAAILSALQTSSERTFAPFEVYNVPPQFCPAAGAIPGYDPTADSWRTFRVRPGLASGRSRYVPPFRVMNNYEEVKSVQQGTDGGTYGAITGETVAVDDAGDFGMGLGNVGTFVLNATPDAFDAVEGSLWIELSDDNIDGLLAQIKCRMTSADQPSPLGRAQEYFPIGPNYIPLARLTRSAAAGSSYKDIVIEQWLGGNILNRFTPGSLTIRGDWDGDGLAGQLFYPNDVVTQAFTVGLKKYFMAFYYSSYGIENTAPTYPFGGGFWTPLAVMPPV